MESYSRKQQQGAPSKKANPVVKQGLKRSCWRPTARPSGHAIDVALRQKAEHGPITESVNRRFAAPNLGHKLRHPSPSDHPRP
jgi:hypothetical protein